MDGWMDDHEGKSFTRTPLQILKLPRLNEHDFMAGFGADLECTPVPNLWSQPSENGGRRYLCLEACVEAIPEELLG